MSWFSKIAQIEYTQIGHSTDTEQLIKNNVVLWVHSGKQLYIQKISDEFSEHYDFGDVFYTYKATGRVDLSKKIGSCEFRTLDENVKKTIIFDLMFEFPDIQFLIFKSRYDEDNTPNPENMENYYQKLKTAQKQQIYDVFINKIYFPKELWPKGIGKEDFEQWKISADSRQNAAEKIWNIHGDRLLKLMGPRKTKLPRKISLHVSSPEAGTGGLPGRLNPILVYTGE